MEKSREGLLPLPGLGAKSQSEVEELITKLGFPINFETKKGEGE